MGINSERPSRNGKTEYLENMLHSEGDLIGAGGVSDGPAI